MSGFGRQLSASLEKHIHWQPPDYWGSSKKLKPESVVLASSGSRDQSVSKQAAALRRKDLRLMQERANHALPISAPVSLILLHFKQFKSSAAIFSIKPQSSLHTWAVWSARTRVKRERERRGAAKLMYNISWHIINLGSLHVCVSTMRQMIILTSYSGQEFSLRPTGRPCNIE